MLDTNEKQNINYIELFSLQQYVAPVYLRNLINCGEMKTLKFYFYTLATSGVFENCYKR